MAPPQQVQRLLSNPSHSTFNKAAPITKSRDFYFKDGNIVLIAQNVAFRVYKGLLARHSALFHATFSVMNGSTYPETFDGCRAVHLSDRSCDVTALLRSLHGDILFILEECFLIASVLRMATKYFVDPLRKFCFKSLHKVYPDDLLKWDEYKGERTFPNAVVQVTGADILLPAAFYRLCSQWSSFRLLKIIPKLPPHLLEIYYRGKEFMGVAFSTFLSSHISFDRRPVCAKSGDCCLSWTSFELMALDYLRDPLSIMFPDPLKWLQDLLVKEAQLTLCDLCHSSLRKSIQEARSEI